MTSIKCYGTSPHDLVKAPQGSCHKISLCLKVEKLTSPPDFFQEFGSQKYEKTSALNCILHCLPLSVTFGIRQQPPCGTWRRRSQLRWKKAHRIPIGIHGTGILKPTFAIRSTIRVGKYYNDMDPMGFCKKMRLVWFILIIEKNHEGFDIHPYRYSGAPFSAPRYPVPGGLRVGALSLRRCENFSKITR